MSIIDRRRSLLAGLYAILIVAGLGSLPSAQANVEPNAAAASNAAGDLAGWWLAIDPLFPTMWDKAGIRAMEELLVVDAKGRAEDRVMQFFAPEAAPCADGKGLFCSDAPIVARARLTISGRHLKVSDYVDGKARVFFPDPKLDLAYHRTVVTGTPSWSMSRSADGRVLTLHSDQSSWTRTLVKVDPDKLRRLRAAFLALGVSALKHWRCFLANATTEDRAFDTIHTAGSAAPDFLGGFLKAASYGTALQDAATRAMPDDPDPQKRKLAAIPLERLMLENFPDIRIPETVAERDALKARWTALLARLNGKPAQVRSPLGDAELDAMGRALKLDGETKQLFCLK